MKLNMVSDIIMSQLSCRQLHNKLFELCNGYDVGDAAVMTGASGESLLAGQNYNSACSALGA